MKNYKTKSGATVLVTMVIISAVILIMALNIGMSSIIQNQINLYQTKGNELSLNLEGCANEALARLNRDNAYTGETIDMDGTSCIITVTGSATTREIDITATNTDYAKELQIDVTIWPEFTINSWNV